MEEPHVHKIFIDKAENSLEMETNKKIWLSKNGLSDADTEEEKAVFAYPIKHYTYWLENHELEEEMGGMGENFAVLEMDEFTVSIGDTFKLGDAVLQVSQPQTPKWELFHRFHIEKHIMNTGKTGWYFRVLEEGYIQATSDLELIDRPYPHWSIAACNEVMYFNKEDFRTADDLLACELLAQSFKKPLRKRLWGF